jgi:hypothetical protein
MLREPGSYREAGMPRPRFLRLCGFLLTVICMLGQRAAPQDVAASQPSLGDLKDGWEEIDQRFVFLTVELSSTEKSIAAINKALVVAGYQQAQTAQRVQNYRHDSDRMDRNGGGPVAWQDFYGKTATAFFFHGRMEAITRPPQMDYIYRADANGQQRAETEAAQSGNRIDDLLQRRRALEAEQTALWCKIAFRALSTRELSDEPTYRFEMTKRADDEVSQEQIRAIAACCKFIRAVNSLSDQAQRDIDANQAQAFSSLEEHVAAARADLRVALLQESSLSAELEDPATLLGRFDRGAKRLVDSSQNLVDANRLAADGDRAGDDQRKQNFRAQLQLETLDFVETITTEDTSLKTLASNWNIKPDVTRAITVSTPSAAPVATPVAPTAMTTPAPISKSNSPAGSAVVPNVNSDTPQESVTPHVLNQGGRVIDLLELIDTEKDAVAGNWQIRDGALVSDATDFARIEIPYQPPAEYDFEIAYTRIGGNDGVAQICSESGHSFLWEMGGWDNRIAGFESIDGWGADKNGTQVNLGIDTGKRYTSLVKVRRDSIAVYLDGKLLSRLTTNYQNMTLDKTMLLRHHQVLGLGNWRSPTVFYSVKVTEITGVGIQLRSTK